MKAIMMSIRPQYVAKILNKEKTIEVRKKFPTDYVGWVYIYCTKNEKQIVFGKTQNIYLCDMRGKTKSGFDFMTLTNNEDNEKFIKDNLNGKVIARFWCDRVIDFFCYTDDLLKQACLTEDKLLDYLDDKNGYAIHITKLEIFDEPKEIKEFHWYRKQWVDCGLDCPPYVDEVKHALTRAPQSFCFVEI